MLHRLMTLPLQILVILLGAIVAIGIVVRDAVRGP